MSGYAHRDIYVRKDGDGRLQAVMRCSGVPAPEGRNPQCQLFEVFPEMPGITFKVNFDRSELLDQVNKIEQAVRDKFFEFKMAGSKAYIEESDARKKFERIEDELEKIRAGGVVYPNNGGHAGEWFRDRSTDALN